MNKLQSLEFDMLKEFVRICDDLGLKYYLVCGSALGAAKYGGFIPWDDDVDEALPRPDYEIFCEKAQSMLPDH
jgi:lipopolysaccharide cholinephosphotransferase